MCYPQRAGNIMLIASYHEIIKTLMAFDRQNNRLKNDKDGVDY